MYIGLWNFCDDEGAIADKPLRLRLQIFPNDSVNIEELLELLIGAGMVERHETYLSIPKFSDHQKISHPAKSTLIPEDSGGLRRTLEDSVLKGREGKGIEWNGIEGKGESASANGHKGENAPRNGHTQPRAKQLPKAWKPTAALIEWARTVPDLELIDLIGETEKFRDHFEANGKAQKDWNAAWRLWIRRSIGYVKEKR